jgi:hypothetical protein
MPAPPPPSKLPEEDNRPYYVAPEKRKSDPRKRKPNRRDSGLYLPIWSLALMLLVVFGIAGGVILLVIFLGGPSNVPGGEPRIIIITTSPSETPDVPQLVAASPTALAQVTTNVQQPAATIALSGPTLVPTQTPSRTPVTIAIGATVTVVGAGGVNVRNAPGLESGVSFTANRNEQYLVIEGPKEVGGLTWWRIRDLQTTRAGWAAQSDGDQDLLQVFVQ